MKKQTREQDRVALQEKLDTQKTQAQKNKLGQFATPPDLAFEILSYAKSLIGGEPVRFLDPSIGTGAFYSALTNTFSDTEIEIAQGVEIDSVIVEETANIWGNTQLNLVEADFTKLSAPVAEHSKFNLIICNPPYVRHHHLDSIEKKRLQNLIQNLDSGGTISGLSGLYCYFLLLTHRWMKSNGIAGWLIPTEFMEVNYGSVLRDYLTKNTTLLRIHRFNPDDTQFADALVSSSIVWFQKRLPSPDHTVTFTMGGSFTNPDESLTIANKALKTAVKWNARLRHRKNEFGEVSTLSDFFDIKRGLATGDNRFFILSEQQVKERNLPKKYLKPILPSVRFLSADKIDADDSGIPNIQKRLFLLDCDLPEENIRQCYPELWTYLQEGIETGVANRYLCSHRKLWYKQENRPAAPFLCTYMARTNKQGRTFRFIFNRSLATAANTYILLYPKPFLGKLIEKDPKFINRVWAAIQEISQASLTEQCRSYGGGLHKLEPKELSRVIATPLVAITS